MKEEIDKLEYLIQRFAFVFTALIFLVSGYFNTLKGISYNLNRTIRWGFDISNTTFWVSNLPGIMSMVFTIGYYRHYRNNRSGKTRFILLNLLFLILGVVVNSSLGLVMLFLLISLISFVGVTLNLRTLSKKGQ